MIRRWEREGVIEKEEIKLPDEKNLRKGVAIIECIQEIPCNPCVDACPTGAISMEDINAIPKMDYDKCIGCMKCLHVCPGLAIFYVKVEDGRGIIALPYEFLPLPDEEEVVGALDREGKEICEARVLKVRKGETPVVIIEIPASYIMDVRNIRCRKKS